MERANCAENFVDAPKQSTMTCVINISLQGHFSADGLSLHSITERNMIEKSSSDDSLSNMMDSLAIKEEGGLSKTVLSDMLKEGNEVSEINVGNSDAFSISSKQFESNNKRANNKFSAIISVTQPSLNGHKETETKRRNGYPDDYSKSTSELDSNYFPASDLSASDVSCMTKNADDISNSEDPISFKITSNFYEADVPSLPTGVAQEKFINGKKDDNSVKVFTSKKVHKLKDKMVKHVLCKLMGSNDVLASDNEEFLDESGTHPEAFSSLTEPNKKDPLNSSKREEVGLSFQTAENIVTDETYYYLGNELDFLVPSNIKERVLIMEVVNPEDEKPEDVIVGPERNIICCLRRKLLVLDLNGLLADILMVTRNTHRERKKIRGRSVCKRPFCDDFLKFCFETFDIGVWSSRRKCNVESILDFIMGDRKHKLLFCWDQSQCTDTGFKTLENMHKPLVLKELKKLWNKEESGLPWEKGYYSSSNTLLVDDSPYKALCNPPHTAIFPFSYHYDDENDNALGPGGDIRVYLQGLSLANDVQLYVQEHPFGQQPITNKNSSWDFYLQVVEKNGQSLAPTQGCA